MNADGTIDTTWFPDADGAVTALAADKTGVYAAGLFKRIGGLNRQNLGRISLVANDSADPTWDPQLIESGNAITRPVQSLVVFNTNVFVGGSFGFARISSISGVADRGPFAEISAMALQPDGMLILAGKFDTVAGVPRKGLARVNGNAPSELDREWDIERMLEGTASSIGLAGLLLGATVNRKWFLLPFMVSGFLLKHAVDGWCPPVPVC